MTTVLQVVGILAFAVAFFALGMKFQSWAWAHITTLAIQKCGVQPERWMTAIEEASREFKGGKRA